MESILLRFTILFFGLFILSVPFGYNILPEPSKYLLSIPIFSDSKTMYLLAAVLLILSFALAILWDLFDKQKENEGKLKYYLLTALSFYLSLQLLIYGFDKLFKHQFYLPEPNILFTPFGQLSKGTLYWSTMGTSYEYNIFMALMEIIPAVLLLFRKTRSIGAILAALVLMNVVAINFSFDISVKVYSCFLLTASVVVAYPGLKKIYHILLQNKKVETEEWTPKFNHSLYALTKPAVICIVFLEALFPYFKENNFNDDSASRPALHGAYQVIENNDSIPFKRFFIHRQGYFITQNTNDEMNDYYLQCDTLNKKIILRDHQNKVSAINYSILNSSIQLSGIFNNKKVVISGTKINTDSLPALKKGFEWTID